MPHVRRLARKAESARQARLRHKQFVTELQQQVDGLQDRVRELEAHCSTGPGSAAVAVRELKGALAPDQLAQLQQWLQEAQGDNHVLVRYENGSAVPPPAAVARPRGLAPGGSAPIAIAGANGSRSWRAGHSTSPMESDDDSPFAVSRSWDDIEGARSILNLTSPNGFHPAPGGLLPTSFSLPSSANATTGVSPSLHGMSFMNPAMRS